MKHISILIPKGPYSIVNIAGTFQILNWANDRHYQLTNERLFDIDLVGIDQTSHNSNGLYAITPMKTIYQINRTDLIIVPAVHAPHDVAIETNIDAIHWLHSQYLHGAEIAAYCIGVFLLAETGLLNHKSCSTHWEEADRLKEMFPLVEVASEKIITDCDGLYTSGGAYAFTNLVIYLIEKFGGRSLAIHAAKTFMVDVDKNDQSVFMMFAGQKHHDDAMILDLQEWIEQNYATSFSVANLAAMKATNRRTLERRFRAATGNSVIQYVQRIRMESAKKILESKTGQVNDAMYAVGYSDSKAFREVFKKHVGVSPSDYRKKFREPVSLG